MKSTVICAMLAAFAISCSALPQSISRGTYEQGRCPDIGVVGVPVGTCPGVSSGQNSGTKPVYLPDANYCHVYHECSNGVPICMYCPFYNTASFGQARQHWDRTLETCNYPESAKCSVNPTVTPSTTTTTTTTTTPSTTTQTTTTPTTTTTTKPTTTTTTPTMTTTTTTTTTPSTTTMTTTTVSNTFFCKDKPDGLYPVPNAQCTKYFYYCSNGMAYLYDCPISSTIFYYDVRECRYPYEVAGCSGYTGEPNMPLHQMT